jgi:hypothetical protein
VAHWGQLYRTVEAGLRGAPGVALIERPAAEGFVGSSFQFRLPGWAPDRIERFLGRCLARGVELKWFGRAEPQGFTSAVAHWRFADPAPMPRTEAVLAGLIDMRLSPLFSTADAALIARILAQEVGRDTPPPALDRTAD